MLSALYLTRWRGALVPAVLALLAAAQMAPACDTPVYRYAMYRWPPAPYEVYYFHDQPANDADQRVGELLSKYWDDRENPANVVYVPVNVVEDKELKRVPPDVKQAFLSRENPTLPTHLIFTPYGSELFYGRLKQDAIPHMVESPARKALAGQLAEGKMGVFVFLESSDPKANQEAEGVLKQLVSDVNQGKVQLYMPPSYGPPPEEGEQGEPAKPKFELGLMSLARDEPQETWFVRSLLAMEPELKEEDLPMVFLAYGRARMLLPYIGKGITAENLVMEVDFITGACSCTVKEQNPGVDMLVRHDWDTTAMKLAQKFGAEEGSPYGGGMFYPELIIPSGAADSESELASADDVDASAESSGGETESSGAPAEPETVSGGDVADQTEPDALARADGARDEHTSADPSPPTDSVTPSEEPAATQDAATEQPVSSAQTDPQPAETTDESSAAQPAEDPSAVALSTPQGTTRPSGIAAEPAVSTSSSYGIVFVVGAGVAVALVVLFGLTFFVLRPQ